MWWPGGGNGGAMRTVVRYMSDSRKRAPNLRKINPKVPQQEAASIAEDLYNVIKQHGPLSVSNTWNHAKEANISGLNSKTHMKIMLKWMMGRHMLKLFCNHVGSNKRFLLSSLPEEPRSKPVNNVVEPKVKAEPSNRSRKRAR
ncbi:unnamed protein product [Cuscuta campestris]|uniref:Uncharacterized protein n=2 Tax=Cuscuta sect. Cleistogrammica TaxID=1824901 RepID=A0A484KRX0_9ASTE|nr:hypothetical protein DM860_007147 [Cuscuta australis]VFQ68731.1 unnamed protein product [Cuscuta campestris]